MDHLSVHFTGMSAAKLGVSSMLGAASIYYLRAGRLEHDVTKLVLAVVFALASIFVF